MKRALWLLIAKDAIEEFFRKIRFLKRKECHCGVALTPLVEDRIVAVYEEAHREEARTMIRERCGLGLPLMHTLDPQAYDRARLAAIKLSGGTLEGLESVICNAQTDWRDVLMAAGFAHDLEAHLNWVPD
jgi:hypothetical protein